MIATLETNSHLDLTPGQTQQTALEVRGTDKQDVSLKPIIDPSDPRYQTGEHLNDRRDLTNPHQARELIANMTGRAAVQSADIVPGIPMPAPSQEAVAAPPVVSREFHPSANQTVQN